MSDIFLVRSASVTPGLSGTTNAQQAKTAEVASERTEAASDAKPTQPSSRPPTRQEMEKAVESANQSLKKIGQEQLVFSIDDETGINVVKLTDKQTGEVIQQIPSKTILAIAQSIDAIKGTLVKQEA